MQISQRAFDFTVAQEVTSRAYYIKHYQNPEWPGLSSGPTIGIGYDLGQANRAKIQKDWNGLVPDAMLAAMLSCSGLTGSAGKAKTAAVKKKIAIPWEAAIQVFAERDVPEWVAGVIRYIPAAVHLPPTCLGVLFDLAYNRGHSWNNAGERYKEMRAIKAHVQAGRLASVPAEIKNMKRLWDGSGGTKTEGLLKRCDGRIELWNYGLKNEAAPNAVATQPAPTSVLSNTTVPPQGAPTRAKPPVTTPTQNTVTASLGAGGAIVAKALHDAGVVGLRVAVGIALVAVVGAAFVWYVWHRNRNP